jgi:hypothetical protein
MPTFVSHSFEAQHRGLISLSACSCISLNPKPEPRHHKNLNHKPCTLRYVYVWAHARR